MRGLMRKMEVPESVESTRLLSTVLTDRRCTEMRQANDVESDTTGYPKRTHAETTLTLSEDQDSAALDAFTPFDPRPSASAVAVTTGSTGSDRTSHCPGLKTPGPSPSFSKVFVKASTTANVTKVTTPTVKDPLSAKTVVTASATLVSQPSPSFSKVFVKASTTANVTKVTTPTVKDPLSAKTVVTASATLVSQPSPSFSKVFVKASTTANVTKVTTPTVKDPLSAKTVVTASAALVAQPSPSFSKVFVKASTTANVTKGTTPTVKDPLSAKTVVTASATLVSQPSPSFSKVFVKALTTANVHHPAGSSQTAQTKPPSAQASLSAMPQDEVAMLVRILLPFMKGHMQAGLQRLAPALTVTPVETWQYERLKAPFCVPGRQVQPAECKHHLQRLRRARRGRVALAVPVGHAIDHLPKMETLTAKSPRLKRPATKLRGKGGPGRLHLNSGQKGHSLPVAPKPRRRPTPVVLTFEEANVVLHVLRKFKNLEITDGTIGEETTADQAEQRLEEPAGLADAVISFL
ncbi:hypothetical protein V5799_011624 [Amblyomma americanum]|uniref:Uncharacterized protein n=1 Tax=Amblyomma americanum TaxID=6943 RepID=A0AAQ4EHA5_AMBAM